MSTYRANHTGKCPHCLHVVRFELANISGILDRPVQTASFDADAPSPSHMPRERLSIVLSSCPHCAQLVLVVQTGAWSGGTLNMEPDEYVIWPLKGTRPIPQEVTGEIRSDYEEAVRVLNLSAKASAALSRRCLQNVLRDKANAQQRELSEQIDAVLPALPGYLQEIVDGIRITGNFAAHPTKSKSSGEIIPVEPGEAEWNLYVLDMLFDHYYVKPAQAKAQRDALNEKLAAAGKPPMKVPSVGSDKTENQ